MKTVYIETKFIKLSQLLKFASIVQNGSDAKFFISEGLVFVDGEVETRRGRKIYDSMNVKAIVDGKEFNILVKKR